MLTRFSPPYRPPLAPIVIKDRRQFNVGFVAGGIAALVIWAGILISQRWEGQEELRAAAVAAAASAGSQAQLAIARAEEINRAVAAYVENCGEDLAGQAWSEAGVADERYQLLTSFIAFSPRSLDEYMPENFELVLWEDLGEATSRDKVGLLVDGAVLEY